ncbi:MAG: T9SS type B sorting domain-containing protein [Nonlabens sp.]
MLRKLCFAITLSIALLSCYSGFSQLQASNWYFGDNAGLNFNPITGAVTPLNNGALATAEGCASISDANGDLLFYTDGITVYDRTHSVMQNGNGLRGDPSSTQSGIIIPRPGSLTDYYIFTVDTPFRGDPDFGLNYYEVDMTLNGGLGAVTTNVNNPTQLLSNCTEKITAINKNNSDEIIVTTLADSNGFGDDNDTFYSYSVSAVGVDPVPVTSRPGFIQSDTRGNLKISPRGDLMVACSMRGGTYLYDFDNNTGAVSNERRLILNDADNSLGFGVEFSPDGDLLYISAASDTAGANDPVSAQSSTLYQFDLTDAAALSAPLLANSIVIAREQEYRSTLQLGIDGKIYRTTSENYDNGRPFLSVINNPEVRGTGCNYQRDAIALTTGVARQGLPPFIQSLFALIQVENSCEGEATTFEFQSEVPPDSILWEFGDGTTSTQAMPSHVYASAGIYNVVLTLTTSGTTRTFRKNVEIFTVPVANAVPDLDLCDSDGSGDEEILLGVYSFDTLIGSQDANSIDVAYFLNAADAQSNTNQISETYLLNTPTQIIYARLFNRSNSTCAGITSFTLSLFELPVPGTVNDIEICDDDFDGFEQFDLTIQTADILTQPASQFEVTFYDSQEDADAGIDELVSPYTNNDPFLQTIFVRIENRNFEECAESSLSFDLIINEKPVANDFDAFQCDEDGVADNRTIFSLSGFDDSVSANAVDVEVQYFLNQANATAGVAELDRISYTNVASPQTIVALVTDINTGCSSIAQVTLAVSASDARDTVLEQCDIDDLADGFTQFDLSIASGDVLIAAPADVVIAYYLTLNDALTEQNALDNFFTNTIISRQVIFARAESPDGNCFGISEVELIVNDLPILEENEFIEFCGNNPQPLELLSGITTGTSTDYTYLWNTGETTPSLSVTTGGIYSVVVTNGNGCASSREFEVVISEAATIEEILVVNAGGNDLGSVEIVVSGLGDYEYSIEEFEGYQDSAEFNDIDPGFYTVSVRDKNGCGITTQGFSIVGYPRFFTPNGDGFNDRWQLSGVNTVFSPDTQVFIYDRYGKLLKQISPLSAGWDGTFDNIALPSSDYWFTATLIDGTAFSGHFSLKR